MRNLNSLDDMQFGFRPGSGTTDAIVGQILEKFIEQKKRLMDGICGPGKSILQSASRHVVVDLTKHCQHI